MANTKAKVSYITQGTGTGEIHTNLMGNGVIQSNWEKVAKTIEAISEVQAVDVDWRGAATIKVNVKNMSPNKAGKVTKKVREQIISIIEQKLVTQAKVTQAVTPAL